MLAVIGGSSISPSSCSPSVDPSLRPHARRHWRVLHLSVLVSTSYRSFFVDLILPRRHVPPHRPPPKKENGVCWGNWQPFPKRTRVPERKINLRGDEGEAPRHSSGGLHHNDAIFNKPPPTGASEFLSLIASHPFYPASRKERKPKPS